MQKLKVKKHLEKQANLAFNTEWSRAKANRLWPTECIGHSKHPLSTTKRRLDTWTAPDGQHQNQIDSILSSQRWRSSIQSAKTRSGAHCGSDHELLIAKFRLKFKKVGKTTGPFNTVQFSPVTHSCPTLFDPMNCSTPGLPVHHIFQIFLPLLFQFTWFEWQRPYLVWFTLLMDIPWLNIKPIIRNFLEIIPCAVEADVYSSVHFGWNVLHTCIWSTGCIVV